VAGGNQGSASSKQSRSGFLPEPDGERKYVDDWMILKDEDEKGPEVHECLCEVVPEQTNVGRKIWGVQDESIHLHSKRR